MKSSEIMLMFMALPCMASAVALLLLWRTGVDVIATGALIYFLILFNAGFFIWDTKHVAHTIVLDDSGISLHTRRGGDKYIWENIDDVVWKVAVFNRAVVGLYMNGGGQVWLRFVRPGVARRIQEAWRDWKKI